MLGEPSLILALENEKFILLVAVIGAAVLVYAISSLRGVLETRAREQTRREMAAYVAEGTIAPADAVRLLGSANEEAEKMIADGVAWGTIKPEKADVLIRTLRSGQPASEAKA